MYQGGIKLWDTHILVLIQLVRVGGRLREHGRARVNSIVSALLVRQTSPCSAATELNTVTYGMKVSPFLREVWMTCQIYYQKWLEEVAYWQ